MQMSAAVAAPSQQRTHMYSLNARYRSLRRPSWMAALGLATLTLVAGAGITRVQLAAAPGPEPAARAAAATAKLALPAVPSYSSIVEKVAPAVVTVRVEKTASAMSTMAVPGFPGLPEGLDPFFGAPRSRRQAPQQAPRMPRQSGLGSGVVVEAQGYILTNHHVIDGADKIRVEFADGTSATARVVGSDQPTDLAVLKVEETGLPTLLYGDSDAAKVGDVVLAFGNPLGVGQTVTMGIVSAKSRATGVGDGSYEDFLQTDAPINQGNSGGALVNLQGELLGINAQILSPSGGNIGLGFAIPASMARAVADQLIKDGKVHRSKLGVTVQAVTPELADGLGIPQVRGALVSGVEAGSPGEKAGLREGDVITELDGQPVADSNQLRNKVATTAPNSAVTLEVLRDGKETTMTARLAARDDDVGRHATASEEGEPAEKLGMSVAPMTPKVAAEMDLPSTETGVVVTDVDPSGVAAEVGFRPGDVVKKVNGREVKSVADLKEAMAARKNGPAMVLVARNGGNLFVAVPQAKS
jgi:Do/DeqQ family serine protease